MERRIDLDLGHDHGLQFYGWHPDRDINPQFDGIPDIERVGAIVWHIPPGMDAEHEHAGSITFEGHATPGHTGPTWTVESEDPLTISPSILCSCGDHGFIKEGRWVPA